MELKEIILYILGGLFGGSWIIQLSPIKINPWTKIAKAIGKALCGDLIEKVDSVNAKVDKLGATMEEKVDAVDAKVDKLEAARGEENAETRRVRILRFSDELQHGVRHSQEHFDQILLDITVYNQYCSDHKDFLNDKTVIATERIKSSYRKRLERNDFL